MTHPTDPNATQIDSYDVSVPLEYQPPMGQKKVGQIITNITVWLLPNQDHDYVLDVESSTFTGDDEAVDNNTASTMYELTSLKGVDEGVDRGYTNCPENCEQQAQATVYVKGCVERDGSGTATSFTPCSGGWAYRTLGVCCPTPPGDTNIDVLDRTGPTCSGGCEETWGAA